MSHALEYTTAPTRPAIAAPRFTTLLIVELRKMVDTRSGRALLVGVVGIAFAIAIGQSVGSREGALIMAEFLQGPIQAAGLIAPVITLLAMTGEFTQRTALTTFTLAPRRLRVVAAKFVAAIALTLVAISAAVMAAMSTALVVAGVSDVSIEYGGVSEAIRGTIVVCPLMAVLGWAVGALIAQTTVAVAVLFVAPTMFTTLGPAVLRDNAIWFDVAGAFNRISSSDPLQDGYQSLTAITLWVLIPAGVSVVRLIRREIT
ncbi:MAG: hypothetical protein ACK5MR_17230 [Cumulibacter sp.]